MTKAFTGEADTNSGFTEEQVRGILSAAGVSEQTLEAAGITVEDIVNGNVSDEMLQQYGISPDIFDGHVSTEEAEQSIMEAEVPKQMQIVAIEGQIFRMYLRIFFWKIITVKFIRSLG